MKDGIAVSVVIPTFNRGRLLPEVVESLWTQTLDPGGYEIIVVDDASTDETPRVLAGLAARSPCRFSVHRLEENRGPAHCRNVGLGLARAEIVAFTDSDCRVVPHWLGRGIEPFARSEVAFVCGPVLDKPEQEVTFFTIGKAPGRGENPIYPTCNIFYRKKHVQELGGFDEGVWVRNIGVVTLDGSDVDLAWRARERGYGHAYLDDLVVYHEIQKVSAWTWLLHSSRVVLLPELARRHPAVRKELLWWGPFALQDNVWFYLGVGGAVGAILGWPWALLLGGPFAVRAAIVPGRRPSLRRLPVMVGRVLALSARQALVTGFLLYGSLRARHLVL